VTAASPAVPAHLGGYTPGGDSATWYTRLWRDLVRKHGVRSMIDVGAGEGLTVEFFAMLGCDAVGVEGTEQPNPRLTRHDYTTGPYDPGRRFDLGWCCEFVEHVEARYERNWLATLQRCDIVLLTHGEPGQGGHHHVNLHYAPYWAERFARVGFVVDEPFTVECRRLARVNPSPWNHFVRSGLAFRRRAVRGVDVTGAADEKQAGGA
jgi:hypothetical protein